MPYAPKPKVTPKVKVSQKTIDKIKGMGMSASLKKAGTSRNAEFVEGVKRMYGTRRLAGSQAKAMPNRPSRAVTPKKFKGGSSGTRMK